MIAYLKGTLTYKEPVSAVIDCNGVGYEVNIPMSTYDKLPALNESTKIYIYYTFNDNDGARLYGFYTPNEKELFIQLIAISKIGPKIALSILSGLSTEDLIEALQVGDVDLLSTIHGIGKKSAERLIIELKDKVGNIQIDKSKSKISSEKSNLMTEAESALITLGYKRYEVKKILSKLLKESDFNNAEKLIKAAIKSLYKKRRN